MRVLSLVVFGTMVLVGPGIREAAACKCAVPTEARADAADARFVGWVADVSTDGRDVVARFVVERAERGVRVGETVVVRTSLTSCGLRFEAGQRWHVAARQGQADADAALTPLWSGGCDGSVMITGRWSGDDIQPKRRYGSLTGAARDPARPIVPVPGSLDRGRAR